MMCYRDRTYCTYCECALWDSCSRALTDEIKKAADEWWGREDEAPICVFADKPDCFACVKE